LNRKHTSLYGCSYEPVDDSVRVVKASTRLRQDTGKYPCFLVVKPRGAAFEVFALESDSPVIRASTPTSRHNHVVTIGCTEATCVKLIECTAPLVW
jgi:hypothetical protein